MKVDLLTIDVEDWYNSSLDVFSDTDIKHGCKPDESVVQNTLLSLELLKKSKIKATHFVLGTVAQHYPDLIKEILLQGHEVASHGFAHQLVYNLTPASFEDDLLRSLEHLTNAGCENILGYRAPYWSIKKENLWAIDVLHKLGFKYDSSIFPIRRGLYGIPNANREIHMIREGMMEVPPATLRVFGTNIPMAGGGYLRIFPEYIFFTLLKMFKNKVNTFYYHPYELDSSDTQLKHELRSIKTNLSYLQQKLGRRRNLKKLKKLIAQLHSINIMDYLFRENLI
jgi:polysaccharide deacetylase family protein (PEP-CTERM system associated)